jgi:hypothetical protein
MVDLAIEGQEVVLRMRGLRRIAALRSTIRIPLHAIQAVGIRDGAAGGMWKGWRMPGTHLPFLIVAGTYYTAGEKRFYDVRRGEPALEIEAQGADFHRVIVGVREADSAVNLIRKHLAAIDRNQRSTGGPRPDPA